jgi:hypothetical protein
MQKPEVAASVFLCSGPDISCPKKKKKLVCFLCSSSDFFTTDPCHLSSLLFFSSIFLKNLIDENAFY